RRAVVVVLHVAPVVRHIALIVLHVTSVVLHVAPVVLRVRRGVRDIPVGPIGLRVSRRAGLGRRCDLDVWTSLSRVLDLCSAHFGDGRWPAAIGLNLLLLLYERDRSRRRWRLGHDGAFLKPCWRSRCNLSASTNYASLLRSNRWRGRIDLRGLN